MLPGGAPGRDDLHAGAVGELVNHRCYYRGELALLCMPQWCTIGGAYKRRRGEVVDAGIGAMEHTGKGDATLVVESWSWFGRRVGALSLYFS